jgi:septin family protein
MKFKNKTTRELYEEHRTEYLRTLQMKLQSVLAIENDQERDKELFELELKINQILLELDEF